MDLHYERTGDRILATVTGTAKEIADLVVAIQGQQEKSKYALIREPYQTNYSLVRLDTGRESSLEAK